MLQESISKNMSSEQQEPLYPCGMHIQHQMLRPVACTLDANFINLLNLSVSIPYVQFIIIKPRGYWTLLNL